MFLLGSVNPHLAACLGSQVGCVTYEKVVFPCGEWNLRLPEQLPASIDVVHQLYNGNDLLQLGLIADALHRRSCRINKLIVPYLGYTRQAHVTKDGHASSLQVLMRWLTSIDYEQLLVVQPHNEQVITLANKPCHTVELLSLFAHHIQDKQLTNTIVVAPDQGARAAAEQLATHLGTTVTAITKTRSKASSMESITMTLDDTVTGKVAILLDDMIDTAGTICKAAALLQEQGASRILVYATHGIFSGPAIDRLSGAVAQGFISSVVVSNTLAQPEQAWLEVVDVSPVLGQL